MTCECENPGFCPRYKREMHGRLREICQGVNVDPGEAAKYRDLWQRQASGEVTPTANIAACLFRGNAVQVNGENVKRVCGPCGNKPRQVFECNHPARQPDQITLPDCTTCDYRPREQSKAKPIILINKLSPGDVLVMTAAVYSLHQANPGKFITAVDTTANAFYEYNPDVISLAEAHALDAKPIQMHYPAIHKSNERGVTFMQGYCEFLADVLNVPVPLATNRPRIYLSKQERTWMGQVQEITRKRTPYWIVCAGRKSDYTTKFWGTENFQRVVNSLRGRITFVQVGAAEHHHPPLKNVINLLGKTDQRQLVRLVYHADGVLSGVTMIQHLAAAMQKPSIVIMGGREPVAWNTYPKQHLLHTVGMLPCCHNGGCWKSRVEPIDDGDDGKNNSLCENPVVGDEVIPKCMALIRPEEVAEKISLVRS